MPHTVTATSPNSLPGGAATQDAITTYVWHDTWDEVTTDTSPAGIVTHAAYDAATGQLLEQYVGSPAAPVQRTTYQYDPVTHQVQFVSTPLTPTPTEYAYDGFGNLHTVSAPNGLTTTVTRDAVGRDSVTVTPISAPTTTPLLQRRQRTTYDLMGRAVAVVDSAPSSAASPSTWQAVHVTTTYDAVGNATAVHRYAAPYTGTPNTITDSTDYDRAGRPLHRFDPYRPGGPLVATLLYDAASHVVKSTTATGTDSIVYDVLNRPLHRYISGVTNAYTPQAAADVQTFDYDASGNLIAANNNSAQVSRRYSLGGALLYDTLRIANADLGSAPTFGHAYAIGYTYDVEGRRTAMTEPTGLGLLGGVSYTYDQVTGALGTVASGAHGTFHYFSDTAGVLDSLIAGDGTRQVFTHDELGRAYQRVETSGALAAFHNDSFSFDGRSKVLSTQSTTFSTSQTTPFTYTGLGSVLSAGGTHSESYTRDALGNALQRITDAPHFAGLYDLEYEPHSTRLSTVSNTPTTGASDTLIAHYDAGGNVLSRERHFRWSTGCGEQFQCETSTWLASGSMLTNQYAGDGRLLAAELTTTNDNLTGIDTSQIAANAGVGRGVFEEYRYDALGRRVWVRAHRDPYCPGADVNAMPICLSTIERFVYDGAQVLYEIRQAGSDTVSAAVLENDAGTDSNQPDQFGIVAYLHGDGIDQPLGLVRRSYSGTQALVLHRDWQGAIDFATVASGSDAGKPIDCGRPGAVAGCETTRWPGADQAIGFQRPVSDIGIPVWWGTLVDGNRNATGVIDMRARQFDPAMGMFTQEDPMGIGGGLNTYGFGGGDAVNMRDPSGMCAEGQASKIVFHQDDNNSWHDWKECLTGDGWRVDAGFGIETWGGRNPFAMLGAFGNAMNTFGDLSGINDLGRGVDDITHGNIASGAFKLALAIPIGGPEARAGLGLAERVGFKTAHAARHLAGTGLGHAAVEEAIRLNILGRAAGSHFGWVQVGGQWIQYRAFEVAPRVFNVGTYFPVSGLFRR